MFFFFKQKTAYEMRISDWSSDVCSSDLCISVFLLLHGFDSHEPIRRVEIAEILLIFDYIFADHLAGFVSVISASPKGPDKPCNRPVSEHIGQNLRPLLRCQPLGGIDQRVPAGRNAAVDSRCGARNGHVDDWQSNIGITPCIRSEEHTSELQSLMRI